MDGDKLLAMTMFQLGARSVRHLRWLTAALLIVAGHSVAGSLVFVSPSGLGDDTAAIQQQLDNGSIVMLSPGGQYTISSVLNMTQGSGIATNGAPAVITMTRTGFNNRVPGPSRMMGENRVGIRALPGAHDIKLDNFILVKESDDGSYVAAIWLQGVERATIRRVHMSGFSLGGILLLDSVKRVSIRSIHIRDVTANDATPYPYYPVLPQITGINIDDMRVVGPNGKPVDSTDVIIANSDIHNLRFGANLANRPRSEFQSGWPAGQVVGFETDGINIQNRAANIRIMGNSIHVVGEGIDTFGIDGLLHNNVIEDALIFSVKLIHGASGTVVRDNVLDGAGYAPIVVAGGHNGSGNTFGNVFYGNELRRIGSIEQFCGSKTEPMYRLYEACSWAEIMPIPSVEPAAFGVWSASANFAPIFNVFSKNDVFVEQGSTTIRHLIQVARATGAPVPYGTIFMSNQLINAGAIPHSGPCPPVPLTSGSFCDRLDSPSIVDTPSPPDTFLTADFDGDGCKDLYFHWKSSGNNELYNWQGPGSSTACKIEAVGSYTVHADPIGPAAINGEPVGVLTSDFSGDGKDDLFFYWSDGANRLFLSQGQGAFQFVNNPISQTSLGGHARQLRIGDFNGDGRDDLFVYSAGIGTNELFLGAPGGLVSSGAVIPAQAINGTPRDALVGDFNGDQCSDLVFFWPDSGNNRMFLGNASGVPIMLADPIVPAAINGGPHRAWVEDLNLDGMDDLTFMWIDTLTRRAFLGRSDGGFDFD